MTDAELASATEILPDRLYYVPLRGKPSEETTKKAHFFTMDSELVYWNFFLDFGPLNLAQTYRFCQRLNSKLKSEALRDKIIYYYCGSHAHKRTNAAFLIAAWSILYLDKTPEEAYEPFRHTSPPFPTFHDASPCLCTYPLSILDCLKGLAKARLYNFFDFSRFNVEEYEHFEQVENGDLNWVVEGKFLAFAGPHNTRELSPEGYFTLTPEDYAGYFLKRNVQLVVRLNKKYYDETKFTSLGLKHLELYYLDGSIPTNTILQTFLSACEATEGAIAVHCKAGLGRTGTCIACYLMKHYRFTAAEAIGWLRVTRPGSIIGPQQHYIQEMESVMWRQGDAYRLQKLMEKEAVADAARGKEEGEVSTSRREGLRSNPLAVTGAGSSNSGGGWMGGKEGAKQGKVLMAEDQIEFGDAQEEEYAEKEEKDTGAERQRQQQQQNAGGVVTATGELLKACNRDLINNPPKFTTSSGGKELDSEKEGYQASQGDSLLHRRAMLQLEQHRRAVT